MEEVQLHAKSCTQKNKIDKKYLNSYNLRKLIPLLHKPH